MPGGDLELLARSLSSPTKRIYAHTPRLTKLGYLINRAGLITQTLSWRTDRIFQVKWVSDFPTSSSITLEFLQ
jgi:hypothetical protein